MMELNHYISKVALATENINTYMILLFHGDKNQKPSPSLSCKIVTRVTLLMAEPTSYVRSLLNLNTFSFYQVRFYLI